MTFSFTNKTSSTKTLPLVKLSMDSNYAEKDSAESTVCNNTTCAIDLPEKITFKMRDLPKVTSGISSMNPEPSPIAVQFSVREEVMGRTTLEDKTVVDDPIVVVLTVQTPKSSNVAESDIETALSRTVSALYEDDGTCRISRLLRGATNPRD